MVNPVKVNGLAESAKMLDDLRAELHEQHLGLIVASRSGWPASILSVYDPQSDMVAISAAGDEFNKLPPELGWVSSLGGRVLDGPPAPHPDFSLHLAIHQICADRFVSSGAAVLTSSTGSLPVWGVLERGVDLADVLDQLGVEKLEPAQGQTLSSRSLAPILRIVEDFVFAPVGQSNQSRTIWQPDGVLAILGNGLPEVIYQAGVLEARLG